MFQPNIPALFKGPVLLGIGLIYIVTIDDSVCAKWFHRHYKEQSQHLTGTSGSPLLCREEHSRKCQDWDDQRHSGRGMKLGKNTRQTSAVAASIVAFPCWRSGYYVQVMFTRLRIVINQALVAAIAVFCSQ